MSNSLGPDQDRRSVDPDLDPNCLQSFSADDIMMAFFETNFFKKKIFQEHNQSVQRFGSRTGPMLCGS